MLRTARLILGLAICTSPFGIAHSAPSEQVSQFISAAKSRVTTPEAAESLQSGPPEEYFRWGEQVCTWGRIEKANFADTTANLAEFFGADLAAALVFAARSVVCPELK